MAEPPVKPSRVEKLTDGSYVYMQDAQGGWGFNNCSLIVSKGQTLLIDTTSDIPMNRKMLKAFEAVEPAAKKIDILFLTHWHVDHVHGACMSEFKNSRIIASEKCADWMADLPPKAWLAMVDSLEGEAKEAMDENLGHGKYFDFSGLSPITPTEIFNGTYEFTVGDDKVEVYEGKMSHTRSDSLVRIHNKSTVHMGDITGKGGLQGLQWPGLRNLMDNLKLLIKWDEKYYVPGHGPMMNLQDVKDRLTHCEWLWEEITSRKKKGMDFEKAADDLTRSIPKSPYAKYHGAVGLYWTTKMVYAEVDGIEGENTRRNYPKYLAKALQLRKEFPKKYPELATKAF